MLTPITSAVKGTGHFLFEFGRGAKEGDFKRMLASPFKGIGHIGGSMWRDTTNYAQYYYRPSYMAVWMQPVGSALMAAGSVPSPASPFLLAGGGLLTIAGGIAGKSVADKKADEANTQQEKDEILRKQQQKNYMYYALGAVLVVGGGYMLFK
jgi:hypothetical protein